MIDLIIPAYKDVEGLARTLESVYFPDLDWLTITVIDDCSPIDYSDVLKQFPNINYYRLEENRGPGFARQYGIEHTQESFFFFVDCGDIILDKDALFEIKNNLELYPQYYLFFFQWMNEKTGVISNVGMRSTQGWVYKRKFFDMYKVRFCTAKDGGYALEDVGFNRTCTCIIKYMEARDQCQYSAFIAKLIYMKIYSDKSITNTGNFHTRKQIPGLAANATLSIHELEENHIGYEYIQDEATSMMMSLYKNFLRCIVEDPETLDVHWQTIRKYYLEVYKKYQDEICIGRIMRRYINLFKKYTTRPNFKKFISDLNIEENYPSYYLTLCEN